MESIPHSMDSTLKKYGVHPPFHGFHMDYPKEGKVQPSPLTLIPKSGVCQHHDWENGDKDEERIVCEDKVGWENAECWGFICITIFVHHIYLGAIGSKLELDDSHSKNVEYVLSNTPELHRSYGTTFHKVFWPAEVRESSLALSQELSCVPILIMMQGFIIL